MLKRVGIIVVLDLLVLGCLASAIVSLNNETRECYKELYDAGLVMGGYNAFFVVRNLIICASCYHTKNPVTNSRYARGVFVCLDCFLYTYVCSWVLTKLTDD